MAISMYYLRTVIHSCQRHIVKESGSCIASSAISNRNWTAIRSYAASAGVKRQTKKAKKEEKTQQRLTREELEERRKDTSRPKPFGLAAWKPVDDVYVAHYYPKPIIQPEKAVELLKSYQKLDFTMPNQKVHLQLQLDMKLEKKAKVNPFVGYVQFPFPFKKEPNKILVFTENAIENELARNAGATVVGGTELIPGILNDEIQVDFYLATPEMVPKLLALKNKLRKRFPKNKRGSVGNDFGNMIKLFKTCSEYLVERECIIRNEIATLDMPLEHIIANLAFLIKKVCEHKPLNFGPFVVSAILTSDTSEALIIDVQKFLPQEAVESEDQSELN